MPIKSQRIIIIIFVAIYFVTDTVTATNQSLESPSKAPTILSIEPGNQILPANTLRFYLHFSTAMKRGQAAEHIWLENEQGDMIESPFLNLGMELWDSEQKRLTLLIDPGRIKNGVGPNLQKGAPLLEDHRYAFVASENIQDAKGVAIGKRQYFRFTTGEPVYSTVDMSQWKLNLPDPNSHEPLIIQFDRIMDSGTSRRMIAIYDKQGKRIKGRIKFSGAELSFTPAQPWSAGSHRMRVNPEIEDVSGNSIRVPFEKTSHKDNNNRQTEIKFDI